MIKIRIHAAESCALRTCDEGIQETITQLHEMYGNSPLAEIEDTLSDPELMELDDLRKLIIERLKKLDANDNNSS